MRVRSLVATAIAITVSAPALAGPVVFVDQSAFLQQVPGAKSFGFDFTFPENEVSVSLSSPYKRGPVTFEGALTGYTDVFPVEYLGANSGTFSVSSARSSIGFRLGSYNGDQTIRYSVGGLSGSLDLPARYETAFIGFTGLAAGDRITFAGSSEIDVLSFAAGVPEPATWALMIVGFGAVGGAMRSRSVVRTAVSVA